MLHVLHVLRAGSLSVLHMLTALHVLHVLQTASPLPSLAAYTPTPPQTKATAIDCSLECSSHTENVY